LSAHKYVPWRNVRGWTCIRCGLCCMRYLVSITLGEAMYYQVKYGPVVFRKDDKYYLFMKPDGSCIFLRKYNGIAYCAIYNERPIVCRLYPFYISKKPLPLRDEKNAVYHYNGVEIYVYIDAVCPGINRGLNIKYAVDNAVKMWFRYQL